jgi:hypothetical protein
VRAVLEPAALPSDADAAEGGVAVAVIPYLFAYAAMTLPGLLGRGKRRPPDPRAGFRPRAASYGDPVPVGWGTFLCPAPAWHRGRTDVAGGSVFQHQLVLGLCQGPITAVHSLRISDGSEDPSSLADVPWADVAARGATLQLGTLTGHTPIANPSFTRQTTNELSLQLDTVNNVGRIKLSAGSPRSFLPTLYGATQLRILDAWIGHPEPNPEAISYYVGRYPYGSGPDFTVVSIADKEIVVANPVATNANWNYLTLHPDNEAVCGGLYVLFDPVGLWHFPGFANIRADPLDVGRLYRPLDPNITVTPAFSGVISAFRATAGPESLDAEGLDVLADMVGTAYWAAAAGVTIQGDVGADGTAASSARNYGRASELGYVSGAMREVRPVAEHMQEVLDAIDCVIFDSEGVLKVRPLGDAQIVNGGVTYTPYVTPVYSLGTGDLLADRTTPAVRMDAASTAQAFNVVSVAFRDRAATGASYRRSVVTAYDQADIDRQKALHGGTGKHEAPVLELPWITSAERARKIAQLRLQRARAVRHSQRVRLGWRDGALLEQMDLILLNDARLGLTNYPVRISAVEEDDDGTITLETVDWPAEIASAPQYATTSSDASSLGVNADPGEASAAVVLPVPAYLSPPGEPEVWIAATGAAEAYAGGDVYLSNDGAAYQFVGRISGRSTMGVLGAALASGAALDNVNTIAVNLSDSRGSLTGTNAAGRDALSTLCWVDGELLAFRDATESTNEPNVYTLASLRRGAHGTTIGAHAAGTRFVRLDEAVLRVKIPPSWFGATVYAKIRTFNAAGAGQVELGDVAPITNTPPLPVVAAPTGTTLAISSTAPAPAANQWRQTALELLHARWARVQWTLSSALVIGFDVVLYTGSDPDAAQARVAEAIGIPANVRDAVLAASAGGSALTVRAAVRARYAGDLVSAWAATAGTGTIDANTNVAQQALVLAGSGTNVTHAATPPATGTAGDLWFNTDTTTNCPDSNCKGHTLAANGTPNVGTYPHRGIYWVHRWNGSAWVDAERQALIAAGEIATGAIVADKIAANAITAGKIEANALKTSNFASTGSGASEVATAGSKMQADGTALLVAPGGLKVGALTIDKYPPVRHAVHFDVYDAMGGTFTTPTGGLSVSRLSDGYTVRVTFAEAIENPYCVATLDNADGVALKVSPHYVGFWGDVDYVDFTFWWGGTQLLRSAVDPRRVYAIFIEGTGYKT